MRRGLCFTCHEPGHKSAKCTKRVNANMSKNVSACTADPAMQSHDDELLIDLLDETSINVSRIGCLKGEPVKMNCTPLETENSDNTFIDADEFHIRS